jgi:hypothetical protein
MAKKYRDDDGMYLALCDGEDGYTFGWYSAEDGYVTCTIGDMFDTDSLKAELHEAKADWELWIIAKVALNMGCDNHGNFKSQKDAKLAMKAANEALLRGDRKPLPKWVVEATNAGWTAPEGWKP